MRGRLLNLSAIARAAGFILVAIAIVATTLHFRETPPPRTERRSAGPAAPSDPLSEELKRCQVLAAQAKDDAACEAAWAESRHRFFNYQPAPNDAVAPDAPPKSSGR